jgi:hypothetical protein
MADIPRIDEFAFILIAGVLMILILMVFWNIPSEAPPAIEPRTMELTMMRGTSESFDITLNGKFSAVNLTAGGDIAGWASFSKNDFDVIDKSSVTVTIKVPTGKPTGTYNGRIEVKSAGGKSSASVTIHVIESSNKTSSRNIPLGDFTVSYTKGDEVIDSKSSVTISKGYFGESSLTLFGPIPTDKLGMTKEAYLQLDMEDSNFAGNLMIVVNGNPVFDGMIGEGVTEIPINNSFLKTSNMVEIKAAPPGWRFWMSTVYKFQSVSFGIKYEGIYSKSFTFPLSGTESRNFRSFDFVYGVSSYSTPLAELMIKINDQVVLWQQPPTVSGRYAFDKDMFGNDLQVSEGNNTISFNFERDSTYSISNAMLIVNYYSP